MSVKKKTTRNAKRAAEIAAIRKRLRDIALGAHGPYGVPDAITAPDESAGLSGDMGMDGFVRFIGGIRNAFAWPKVGALDGRDRVDYYIDLHNLHKFNYLDSGAEHLWECGVRA